MSTKTARPGGSDDFKGRKRKWNHDEISEGVATDWLAATKRKQKRRKPRQAGRAKQAFVRSTASGVSRPVETSQPDDFKPGQPVPGIDANEIIAQSLAAEADARQLQWKADPQKLPPGKKKKYYGVRFGYQPGIYYSWKDAEPQVNGFHGAVYQSAKDPRAIERFMNHLATECEYPACKGACEKAIARTEAAARVQVPDLRSTEATQRMAPSPGSAADPRVCSCGKPANASNDIVHCANAPHCRIGTYHKICVGLANRNETTNWRCVKCRPTPSAKTLQSNSYSTLTNRASSESSHQPWQDLPALSSGTGPRLKIEGQEPPLHQEQERVVACIEAGNNVFYTGSAGTGKSTILRAFVQRLRKLGKRVDIVAIWNSSSKRWRKHSVHLRFMAS